MKLNISQTQKETMNHHRPRILSARLAILTLLFLVMIGSLVEMSKATGVINKEDLAGPWGMTLTGDTGCGISTSFVTFTLNSTGSAPDAFIKGHTQGCGDHTTGPFPFTILTLAPNGRGTANLSCGPGCGWNLEIQVAPDRSLFSVVDISPANPNNYLEGIAIHQ